MYPDQIDIAVEADLEWGPVTPLMASILAGDAKGMRLLLQTGRCNPVRPNRLGNSALHILAAVGNVKLAKVLKSYYRPSSIRDDAPLSEVTRGDKFTPFHLCVIYGNGETLLEYLRELLYSPSKIINLADAEGLTALHWAISQDQLVVADRLMTKWGALNKGEPLRHAMRLGKLEFVKLICRKFGCDVPHAAHYVAGLGHTAILIYLIEELRLVSIHSLDESGRSILWHARQGGHLETASTILRLEARYLEEGDTSSGSTFSETESVSLATSPNSDIGLCDICMEVEIDHIFVPCGHRYCCGGCGVTLTRCPVCRQPIQLFMKMF